MSKVELNSSRLLLKEGVRLVVGFCGEGDGWFWGLLVGTWTGFELCVGLRLIDLTLLVRGMQGAIERAPTNSTSKDKWPSPPPLPQRSPRVRRRHNLCNYTSLVSTNRNSEVCSSVGVPPPNTSTSTASIMCFFLESIKILVIFLRVGTTTHYGVAIPVACWSFSL